jgi:hypothetical protein
MHGILPPPVERPSQGPGVHSAPGNPADPIFKPANSRIDICDILARQEPERLDMISRLYEPPTPVIKIPPTIFNFGIGKMPTNPGG